MQGANDRTLMALGGWNCPAMLSRYAHLSPTHLWNAVEGLTDFKGRISDETVTGETGKEAEAAQPIDFTGEPRATRTLGPRPFRVRVKADRVAMILE